MDIWITLVHAAIIGGILWSLLNLTRRSLQSLRSGASESAERRLRPGAVAARLENDNSISVKGAGK